MAPHHGPKLLAPIGFVPIEIGGFAECHAQAVDEGGEGLVIRMCGQPYPPKRIG
jgi:hypothetical protein